MPYVSADHMSNAQPPWLAIKNPCEMKLLRRCLLASLHLSGRLISHGLTMPRSLHFVPPFGRERKSRRRQGLAKVSADVPVGAVANDVALRTLQANSCEGSVLSLELGWVWLQSHPVSVKLLRRISTSAHAGNNPCLQEAKLVLER